MPGMKGRKGFIPTCHTEMARWACENGYTAREMARQMGISDGSVQRHFRGQYISPVIGRLYKAYYPEMPCPLRGQPQLFVHPLPLRKLPLLAKLKF